MFVFIGKEAWGSETEKKDFAAHKKKDLWSQYGYSQSAKCNAFGGHLWINNIDYNTFYNERIYIWLGENRAIEKTRVSQATNSWAELWPKYLHELSSAKKIKWQWY